MRSSSPRVRRVRANAMPPGVRHPSEVRLWAEAISNALGFGHPRLTFGFRNSLLRD
ncbi:hypothetical protein [Alicyclobacillus sp.]|uniref:hypothetical protein n=1 Tax=Alicyclobacillus sp. TaxID=61169 RepID=UPI0025BACBFA|nr:hypothetical protein [Alicyclobacillus sp.]MCL6515519.1 hypothetical protein [Alicyclobacillus sp.]